MKKLITSILTFTLVLFTLGATTFAWWNLSTDTKEETLTIGTGAVIQVELDSQTQGVLIPKGVALLDGQVNEIILDYSVDLENPISDGELFLEVLIDNVLFDGVDRVENPNLRQYLVFEIYENPMLPEVDTFVRVMDQLDQTPTIFIRITLDMDENTPSAHVAEIKDSVITFDVVFTVSDLHPNQ